ncbi:MAG: hypothetical protein R2795_18760 [Saprospiraceae bacterium]
MKIINQQLLTSLIVIVLLVSCNNTNHEKEINPKENDVELLKKEIVIKEEQAAIDTISTVMTEKSNSSTTVETENIIPKSRLAGKHNLTIQWIGWDHPGEITFNDIGDNQYEVDGFQKGKPTDECPDCYLKVKGTIKEITPKRLRFTGKIESSIYHIQGGIPCVKEGTFDFVSTKNRKYWRCQNMAGCDGVTDYVDIYF